PAPRIPDASSPSLLDQRSCGQGPRGPSACLGTRSARDGSTLVSRCYALGDGGSRQPFLLVALAGGHVRGVPPPILLPLLRRLGRLGEQCAAGRPTPVRPEAADGAAGLGRAHGA